MTALYVVVGVALIAAANLVDCCIVAGALGHWPTCAEYRRIRKDTL